jgi:hypothetical protein
MLNPKPILDQVDIGISYATDADDVLGSLRAKKAYAFGSKIGSKGGSAALEFFGEADVNIDKKVALTLTFNQLCLAYGSSVTI